jgi:hypothetical protein
MPELRSRVITSYCYDDPDKLVGTTEPRYGRWGELSRQPAAVDVPCIDLVAGPSAQEFIRSMVTFDVRWCRGLE